MQITSLLMPGIAAASGGSTKNSLDTTGKAGQFLSELMALLGPEQTQPATALANSTTSLELAGFSQEVNHALEAIVAEAAANPEGMPEEQAAALWEQLLDAAGIESCGAEETSASALVSALAKALSSSQPSSPEAEQQEAASSTESKEPMGREQFEALLAQVVQTASALPVMPAAESLQNASAMEDSGLAETGGTSRQLAQLAAVLPSSSSSPDGVNRLPSPIATETSAVNTSAKYSPVYPTKASNTETVIAAFQQTPVETGTPASIPVKTDATASAPVQKAESTVKYTVATPSANAATPVANTDATANTPVQKTESTVKYAVTTPSANAATPVANTDATANTPVQKAESTVKYTVATPSVNAATPVANTDATASTPVQKAESTVKYTVATPSVNAATPAANTDATASTPVQKAESTVKYAVTTPAANAATPAADTDATASTPVQKTESTVKYAVTTPAANAATPVADTEASMVAEQNSVESAVALPKIATEATVAATRATVKESTPAEEAVYIQQDSSTVEIVNATAPEPTAQKEAIPASSAPNSTQPAAQGQNTGEAVPKALEEVKSAHQTVETKIEATGATPKVADTPSAAKEPDAASSTPSGAEKTVLPTLSSEQTPPPARSTAQSTIVQMADDLAQPETVETAVAVKMPAESQKPLASNASYIVENDMAAETENVTFEVTGETATANAQSKSSDTGSSLTEEAAPSSNTTDSSETLDNAVPEEANESSVRILPKSRAQYELESTEPSKQTAPITQAGAVAGQSMDASASPEASASTAAMQQAPPSQIEVRTSTIQTSVPAAAPIIEHATLETLGDTAIRSIRLTAPDGEQTITVRLSPASLGEVRIEVTHSQDSMNIRLASSNAGVRELLEAQAPHLRQNLALDGIDKTNVSVSAQMSSGQDTSGSMGRQGSPATPQSMPAHTRPFYSEAQTNSSPRTARGSRHEGALNVFV